MEMRNVVWVKKVLCAVLVVMALCAGAGFAMQDGMGVVEAKQAVKLSKSQVRLAKGEKIRLQLQGAKGKAVWKSKNQAVASVDKNGVVKAKKNGKTKVSVKYGRKAYSCTVWVETPKINRKSMSLKVGDKAQLKISGTKQKVSWSCGAKGVAAVNKKGLVTARKAGKATVTAKVGTKKYQCRVTVKAEEKEDTKPIQKPDDGSQKPDDGSQKPDDGGQKPDDGSQDADVQVWLEEGTLLSQSQTLVTVVIENRGDQAAYIADGYTLYRKQEGQWVSVPLFFASSDGTKTLEPGKKMKRFCRLLDASGKCQAGEYRIVIGTLQVEFQILNEGPTEGLEMRIKEGNVILEGQPTITVQIENHSSIQKEMSRNMSMYVEQDGEWVMYSSPIDTDDMIYIKPGEILEMAYPLWRDGENCQPGKYRVKKHVYEEDDLVVEFEIAARTEPVQDLKVWVKEGDAISLSQKQITVVVENPSDVMKWMTYGYSIWMKQGEEWTAVPMNVDFPDVMFGIKPGETKERICMLEEDGILEALQPGEYRVSMGADVTAFFRIREDTDPAGVPEMQIVGDDVILFGQPSIPLKIVNHSTATEYFSRYTEHAIRQANTALRRTA